jgi:hypothetical protein
MKGSREFGHYKTINLVHDVDSKVPRSNPLVKGSQGPAWDTGTGKTANLPVTMVAELKLNSVKNHRRTRSKR